MTHEIARPSKGIVKVWTKFVDQRETKSKEEANDYIQKRNSEEEEDFLKKSKFKNEKEKERARIGFRKTLDIFFEYDLHRYALKYGMELYQFNCLERTYRELEFGAYDKQGNFLSGGGYPKDTLGIEPGSQIEKLYKKVCR